MQNSQILNRASSPQSAQQSGGNLKSMKEKSSQQDARGIWLEGCRARWGDYSRFLAFSSAFSRSNYIRANKFLGATVVAGNLVKASASKWFGPSVVANNLVKASVNKLYGATADKYIGASDYLLVSNWME